MGSPEPGYVALLREFEQVLGLVEEAERGLDLRVDGGQVAARFFDAEEVDVDLVVESSP